MAELSLAFSRLEQHRCSNTFWHSLHIATMRNVGSPLCCSSFLQIQETHASLKGYPGWGRLTVNLAGFRTSQPRPSSCDCSQEARVPSDKGVAPGLPPASTATSCPSPSSSSVLPAPAKAQHRPGTQSLLSLTQWEGPQGAMFILRGWFPRWWLGCHIKAPWFS